MLKVKKAISILMASSLLLSLGCSKPENNAQENGNAATPAASSKFNKGGTFPICKEKVSLTVTLPASTQVEDYETNRQTQIIEEKGNFDLTFNVIPSAEFDTKINLMVAAGGSDLGDVLMRNNFKDASVYSYAQAGAIVPLTKYFKDPDASYYTTDALKRTGVDFLPQITSPDGEIYGLPRYNQSIGNEYSHKLWMFTEWLAKLNLKAPATPDELYNVLKAFKTQDPNGNGKADEIPLVGYTTATGAEDYWLSYLMNPFVYAGDPEFLTVDDGKLGLAYTTDGWKEGLHYAKKLVSEGLFSPLTLTQDKKSYTALLGNKETIVGAFVSPGTSDVGAKDPRCVQYAGVAPLTGKNGTQYASFRESAAYAGMLVTKNCKDVDAAFRLGDYMVSEEISIHTRWGEKGVDYFEPKAGDVSLYEKIGYKTSLKEGLAWGGIQNKLWAQMGPFVRQYSIAAGVVFSGNPLDTALPVAEATMLYLDKKPKQTIPKLTYTEAESDEISEPLKSLKNYVRESYALFITGAKDIDKDWDSYLKEIEKIGGSRVVKINQQVYDRMYKMKK